jgi:hypothetical protein
VNVEQGQDYRISLDLTAGQGILAFYGSRQALESSWDDPLPYGWKNTRFLIITMGSTAPI